MKNGCYEALSSSINELNNNNTIKSTTRTQKMYNVETILNKTESSIFLTKIFTILNKRNKLNVFLKKKKSME